MQSSHFFSGIKRPAVKQVKEDEEADGKKGNEEKLLLFP